MQAAEQSVRVVPTARILTMIVCPACHAALAMDGACVRCAGCHVTYSIKDGILVLTPRRLGPDQSTDPLPD